MSGEGVDQEGEGVALLSLEGGDDGHDAFDKVATADAVGTKAELAPDDQPAEQALSEIVGGRQIGLLQEAPHGVLVGQESTAKAATLLRSIDGRGPAFPQALHAFALGRDESENRSLLGGRDEFCEFCFNRSSRLRIRSMACASEARSSSTSASRAASAARAMSPSVVLSRPPHKR